MEAGWVPKGIKWFSDAGLWTGYIKVTWGASEDKVCGFHPQRSIWTANVGLRNLSFFKMIK